VKIALSTTISKTENAQIAPAWERKLGRRLPLFGHRNWIVVADAAYPVQSNPGIETIVTGADHLDTVSRVYGQIAASSHVRSNIYLDHELDYVSEGDAPGVGAYRQQLQVTFGDASVQKLPHEQIIAKLDQCAQLFRVLILKTDLTIPYTSVFFELDCGYWSPEAEARLRKAMQK
jgi:hypothetical protein